MANRWWKGFWTVLRVCRIQQRLPTLPCMFLLVTFAARPLLCTQSLLWMFPSGWCTPVLLFVFSHSLSLSPVFLCLRYVASCAKPSDQTWKNICRSGCTWKVWHQCVCGSASSVRRFVRNAIHSLPRSICKASHLYVSSGVPSGGSFLCKPSDSH